MLPGCFNFIKRETQDSWFTWFKSSSFTFTAKRPIQLHLSPSQPLLSPPPPYFALLYTGQLSCYFSVLLKGHFCINFHVLLPQMLLDLLAFCVLPYIPTSGVYFLFMFVIGLSSVSLFWFEELVCKLQAFLPMSSQEQDQTLAVAPSLQRSSLCFAPIHFVHFAFPT